MQAQTQTAAEIMVRRNSFWAPTALRHSELWQEPAKTTRQPKKPTSSKRTQPRAQSRHFRILLMALDGHTEVNTPSHECDGFSAKPRSNLPASRPKASSWPHCPEHTLSRHALQRGARIHLSPERDSPLRAISMGWSDESKPRDTEAFCNHCEWIHECWSMHLAMDECVTRPA